MDYCLIESWEENCTLPEISNAVALAKEAVFQFEQYGIQYITHEECCPAWEIRCDTDKSLMKQFTWFDDFERLQQQAFPDAVKMGINLATIYYYITKCAADHTFRTTRGLREFMDSVIPGKIWYIGPKYSADRI